MPILHPSTFLPTTILAAIRSYAAEAEQKKQLHEVQLKLIHNERWFKMFVPSSYGGLGFSLPKVLKTEEALAWADGSTAWVVTLCSGAGWFIGFLPQEISNVVFFNDEVCLAGSGAPSGTADVRNDGYIINGVWKYASGALHATVFTANCLISKDGIPVLDNKGKPQVKAFVFFPDEVVVQSNWSSMGMIATGSHGFAITDRFVPSKRAFHIDSRHATLSDPIYQYPFMQLAEATLAANLSGMAQQFVDLCRTIFAGRMVHDQTPEKDLLKLLEESHGILQECRTEFYQAVEESWSICKTGHKISAPVLRKVSDTSYKLYLSSLSQVNALYRYAGLLAANPQMEINRVWRNIHTASQHALFSMR
jgi:alkylation response protein AidB-like acyl-CoA dehydrogenase